MQDEAEWIRKAKSGDEDAFGELVRAYHPRVAGLLTRMVRNAEMAQELEQQTWIKVWKNLPRFQEKSAFFSWVYTIATRTALDHRRKKIREDEVPYDEALDHPGGAHPVDRPDRQMMRDELGVRIREALDKCSEKHRTVLILREMEGLSYEEIAEVLRCRVGTVMSRLHHARLQVRQHLQEVPS
jgi:RNA polymerase sigma-70 factor (ECF subfamily)